MRTRRHPWLLMGLVVLALAIGCAGAETVDTPEGTIETVAGGGPAQVSSVKSYKELEFPPLREVRVPEIGRQELSNGMVLFTLEDHELPLVRARAIVLAGSIYEPADKVGLASITGTVMRTGGTETRPGDSLDQTLEEIAASVETGIGSTSGSASLSCLKENFDEVLEIFADVMMNPAFPDDKIDLAKVQGRTAISRRNDSPGSIVGREFSKLIYGPESPYARHTEYATIDAITRDDLSEFHKAYLHPDRILLAVWGDIDPADVRAKVEKAFSGWERSDGSPPPPPPEPTRADSPRVNYIHKSDINQTNIRIGHLGIKRDDPDYYSVVVMNDILGGGFSSRLFENVRSKKGLAYSVGSFYRAPFDRRGLFALYCQTKSETTMGAINEIIDQAKRIRSEEVSDDELQRSKDGILNSFVFNFDSSAEIIGRRMDYEFYGYPADLLEQYRAGIAAVTKIDVLQAAKKHLHPDSFTLLAVGREEDFDMPLSTLGAVNEIDIETALEVPSEEVPEATAETKDAALDLLAAAVEAHGGESALAEITAYRGDIKAKVTFMPGRPAIEISWIRSVQFPNRFRNEIQTPMGLMVQVLSGEEAWVQQEGGEPRELQGSDRKEIVSVLFRDPISLLQRFGGPDVEVQMLEGGDATTPATVLVSSEEGHSVKVKVDNESKRLVGLSYTLLLPMEGPQTVEETFSDFREVSGVVLPFKSVVKKESGDIFRESDYQSLEINPDLADELFLKPGESAALEIPEEEAPPGEAEGEPPTEEGEE